MMHVGMNFVSFLAWNLLDLLNDIGIFHHFWKVLIHNIFTYFLCFIPFSQTEISTKYIYTYMYVLDLFCLFSLYFGLSLIFSISFSFRATKTISSVACLFYLIIILLDMYNLLFSQTNLSF